MEGHQIMDGKIKRVAPLPAPGASKAVCTLFLEQLAAACGDAWAALESICRLHSTLRAPSLEGIASAATLERPFLRHTTMREVCLLWVLARLPIVMPWHAMTTISDSGPVRSGIRAVRGSADAVPAACAPARQALLDRSSRPSGEPAAIPHG